jgi:hypothetical protein
METLLAHCVANFSEHSGLFAVFFFGGLTGGFTHCFAMCGSVVASEAVACGSCNSGCGKKSKISSATSLSYHLGRMTTYGALGFFAALLSKQIASLPIWHFVSAFMLFIAGAMFLLSSLPSCHHTLFKTSSKNSYIRGVLLGFMPCGLLYAALMMAATLANPLAGMFAMWLFVLGTIPALLIASVGANMLTKKWQAVMQKIGRAVMAFNGISLLVMAGRMVR